MRLLDLFAGIGGFSLAAHWMGWQTAAFVEKEPFCQKVLRKNFGADIEIHDDIFNFSGEPFRGRVDIVTGGFPCQPFSAAGKRKGRADERHLFPEMLRVVREVQPRWVVAENVRGLLSIESGQVFAEVVASLEGEGFEVVTFCVPASAVEAPHRRDRLWIVAHAKRDGREVGALLRQIREESAGKIDTFYASGTDCILDSADARHTHGSKYRTKAPNASEEHGVPKISRRMEHGSALLGRTDRVDPHTNESRLQGYSTGRPISEREITTGHSGSSDRNPWRDGNWIEAATRLCRVDDGVSDRVQRLKALGNSIVPQIAFEIFRALEAAEKNLPAKYANERELGN